MSCVKLLLKLRSNEGAVDRFLDLQLADNRHRFKLGVVARLAWSQRTVGRHRVMTHMNDIGPGGTPFGQEVRNLPFCVRIVARSPYRMVETALDEIGRASWRARVGQYV